MTTSDHYPQAVSGETPAAAAGVLISATLLQSAPQQVAPVVRSAAFVTASTRERRGYRWVARESSDAQ